MAIYRLNGSSLYSAYDINGNDLSTAYDGEGNVIFREMLKVMSFNEMGYKGINANLAMQRAIIDLYDADIIGFQEFCTNGIVPTYATNSLTAYPYLRLSNHVNYNAVASKLPFGEWTIKDYDTQDPVDTDTRHETRCYMKTHISYAGKNIAFFNTHLCVNTATDRYAQMTELFEAAEQEEYSIITGDFNSNTKPLTAETDDYIYQYKQFVDAGYKLANNSPTAGFTNTHTAETAIESLADLTSALDSIIVSGNIDIVNVVFDPTKLSYQNNTKFDHIPVIATLRIN